MSSFDSLAHVAAGVADRRSPSVVNEPVFRWWDYPLFILLTVTSGLAIAAFLSHWCSETGRGQSPAIFSLIGLLILSAIAMHQFRWFMLLCMKKPCPMRPCRGWRVGVATTYVPGGESLPMLEQTVRALVALDYPHDTWVLDEGDDAQVKALCSRLGARHFSRKSLPQYHTERGIFQSRSKHGNYNAWLHEIGFASYDIITAFDPDHVPARDFLFNVLGYFADPKIGYVQAAQAYGNQKTSFIACGAAEETYAYYSSVQMACYGMGYPIIIGCHNTHRVVALKQVGGFAPHDADDILITLFYRDAGWQGVYVPKILARGMTPPDWTAYLNQQRRWARSVLDLKLRTYPKLASGLPFQTQVMSLLHGFNYLYKSFAIASGLALLAVMCLTGTGHQIIASLAALPFLFLCVTMQLCEFYRQRFYLDWRNEWGLHWRAAILHYAKWPYMLGALCDVLLNRRFAYTLTPKNGRTTRRYEWLLPHVITAAIIGLAGWAGTSWGLATGYFFPVAASLPAWAVLFLALTEYLAIRECPKRQSRGAPGDGHESLKIDLAGLARDVGDLSCPRNQ